MFGYKTVSTTGRGEYTEKKSRFLAEAVHVETAGEAEAYLESVRKAHYDARHHCFAYIAGEPGTTDEIMRSGDDGEPSGTAGKPMLEILTGEGLHRTLLVVTRYFGGVLLGTGGLVRAYTKASKEALANAEVLELVRGTEAKITCSYPAYDRLLYHLSNEGVTPFDTFFHERVSFAILFPEDEEETLFTLITRLTEGQAEFQVTKRQVFAPKK
jgi:uncharacterized YigZ family protein